MHPPVAAAASPPPPHPHLSRSCSLIFSSSLSLILFHCLFIPFFPLHNLQYACHHGNHYCWPLASSSLSFSCTLMCYFSLSLFTLPSFIFHSQQVCKLAWNLLDKKAKCAQCVHCSRSLVQKTKAAGEQVSCQAWMCVHSQEATDWRKHLHQSVWPILSRSFLSLCPLLNESRQECTSWGMWRTWLHSPVMRREREERRGEMRLSFPSFSPVLLALAFSCLSRPLD